jgi:hypothetical protein
MIGGETHAFLLTPTPEPACLSLLALGGMTLFRRNRRSTELAEVRRTLP